MLLSMTGYGESRGSSDSCACTVEIRSVNNRFLKINTRISESHQSLQDQVERVIRNRLARGSVTVNIRVRTERPNVQFRVNRVAVESYLRQITDIVGPNPAVIGHILTLPGVVDEAENAPDIQRDWPLIESEVNRSIDQLEQMRTAEGAAVQAELMNIYSAMMQRLEEVESSSSQTVSNYRQKIQDRVNALLSEFGVSVDESALVREVAIFAERCDIAEELSRLRSHLVQFELILNNEESPGRKLDFLTQEMYRETNTIGSKANDARVSQVVVDLKGKIEQAREIVQNIE